MSSDCCSMRPDHRPASLSIVAVGTRSIEAQTVAAMTSSNEFPWRLAGSHRREDGKEDASEPRLDCGLRSPSVPRSWRTRLQMALLAMTRNFLHLPSNIAHQSCCCDHADLMVLTTRPQRDCQRYMCRPSGCEQNTCGIAGHGWQARQQLFGSKRNEGSTRLLLDNVASNRSRTSEQTNSDGGLACDSCLTGHAERRH